MLNLLLAPIKTYLSLFTALALPNFIPLLRSQTFPTRRSLAGEVAKSLLHHQTPITTPESLETVMEILKVLIKEGHQQTGYPGGPMRRGQETEETLEEQGWLARIVHQIKNSDSETQLKVSFPSSTILITQSQTTNTPPAPPNHPPRLQRRRRPHKIHHPSNSNLLFQSSTPPEDHTLHFPPRILPIPIPSALQIRALPIIRTLHPRKLHQHDPRIYNLYFSNRRSVPSSVSLSRPSSRPMQPRRNILRILRAGLYNLRGIRQRLTRSIPSRLHNFRFPPSDPQLFQG